MKLEPDITKSDAFVLNCLNVCLVVMVFMFLIFCSYVCIESYSNIQSVVAKEIEMQEQKQIIVMVFSAGWCAPCQTMKRTTWSNPQLKKYIKDNQIELYNIDVDKDRNLSQQYGATSIPCVVVLERLSKTKAKEINRFIGVRSAKEVQEFIEKCKNKPAASSIIETGIDIDNKAWMSELWQ